MKPIPAAVKRSIAIRKLSLPALLLVTGLFCLGKYFSHQDFFALLFIGKESPVAEGKVTSRWIETWDEYGYPGLYGYAYEFYSPSGEYISWVSYHPDSLYKAGDTISIRYNENEPRINRAVGMKNSNSKSTYLGFGIGICILSILTGYLFGYFQTMRILTNGHLARGELIRKKDTGMVVNDKKVYEFLFRYITQEGKEITYVTEADAIHTFGDLPYELLVYHEKKPKRIVLIDSLPLKVREFFYKAFKQQAKQVS